MKATRPLLLVALSLLLVISAAQASSHVAPVSTDADRVLAERKLQPMAQNLVNWLSAVAKNKLGDAERIYGYKKRVARQIADSDFLAVIKAIDQTTPFSLQLVGINPVSTKVNIFYFVGTTPDASAGIKVTVYEHGEKLYVGNIEYDTDWDDVEQLANTVLRLNTPLELKGN